jgi:demethoxyubiquinone hydroxylase (CLK1/Coq7/Cat5 family)
MHHTWKVGTNLTGTAIAPERCQEMVRGTREFRPIALDGGASVASVREQYARESEPVGGMPPPPNVKEAMKTAGRALRGDRPMVVLDKLGERLAFERTGVRLYDGLLAKLEATGSYSGGPSREDLAHHRAEELEHMELVKQAIETLGGDPTAMTPSADVQATASMGLTAVIADPRTDLLAGLEAILVAELADNDCWDALVEIVAGAEQEEIAHRFEHARAQEREHLARVRRWVAAGQGRPSV